MPRAPASASLASTDLSRLVWSEMTLMPSLAASYTTAEHAGRSRDAGQKPSGGAI